MEKKLIRRSTIASLIIAGILALWDWPAGLGCLLGAAGYYLYYFLLTASVDEAIRRGAGQPAGKGAQLANRSLRLLVLAVPLLISFLLPRWFRWWGALIGLLMYKIVAVIWAAAGNRER
jgi:hypothetical protein